MITISLKHGLTLKQEVWLTKNVGPRLHHTHMSIGGQGWIAKKNYYPMQDRSYWTLTFEDEKYATFFRLLYPE